MNRDPRTRLPLAGLLIIFVAPLATLMIMVPTLFAGGVQKVERAVPAIISRLIPNPSPHLHGPHLSPLPPVAVGRGTPAENPAPPYPAPRYPAAPVTPNPAPVPPPPPAVTPPPPTPVTTTSGGKHSNKGRHRRRRPNQNNQGQNQNG